MTVFITNELRGRNVSDALRFGSMSVVLAADFVVTDETVDTMVDRIEAVLSDFSDDDFLLLSGDPVVIGTCCAIAALNNNGRFSVLRWDRQDEHYIPVHVDIGEIYDGGESSGP